ncbi:MAG: FKBP-type peptidyl-prolyl cis-trans isomerase [Pseudomonadota bacterium]|nr:FKBP-type peptidyl-prolyl cis-trans isomerase [Pseudomonadota bacterium]
MAAIHSSKIILVLSLALSAGCSGKSDKPAAPIPVANPVASLQKITVKPGSGAEIGSGQIAVVQYTGWLYEAGATDQKGKQFDSSRNAGQPFKFSLDTGAVIKGWDQGVVGMKVGEIRRLIIPPDLAYGDRGAGGVIPPGATLVFDVELVQIG